MRDEPGSVFGIEAMRTHTDASHCDWTWAPGGGTKHPITPEVLAERSQYLSLDYKAIYRFAVDKMVDATHEVLNAIDLTVDDVDWLIPAPDRRQHHRRHRRAAEDPAPIG